MGKLGLRGGDALRFGVAASATRGGLWLVLMWREGTGCAAKGGGQWFRKGEGQDQAGRRLLAAGQEAADGKGGVGVIASATGAPT